MKAENIQQISDQLWTSGQIDEHDIGEIRTLGVEVVINLALPTSNPSLPREAELVTGAGMSYFQIPVPWEKPELYHLDLFLGLLGSLKGRRVWVHCAKNFRVSSFVYLYRRICLGESDATAKTALCAVWQPNEIWEAFIQSALKARP
jgi:protein tyrosine phosphatase (PTP) superfamily phosphohydrolase (DUF442 family)